jgi:hypothetical protein
VPCFLVSHADMPRLAFRGVCQPSKSSQLLTFGCDIGMTPREFCSTRVLIISALSLSILSPRIDALAVSDKCQAATPATYKPLPAAFQIFEPRVRTARIVYITHSGRLRARAHGQLRSRQWPRPFPNIGRAFSSTPRRAPRGCGLLQLRRSAD